MVEVMVAVLVASIGLLGLAKMQALALTGSGAAKVHALASIQAAGLASTMRADRAYWGRIKENLTVAIASDGTVKASDSSLNSPTSTCTSTTQVCTSSQIAALDLKNWTTGLLGTLPLAPNAPSTITCLHDSSQQNPVSCSIVLNWIENAGPSNNATARQSAPAPQRTKDATYTLYVNP